MPPFTWAKLDRAEDDSIRAALPLIDHCLDVGAAMEALLAGHGWQVALATTAGRALTPQDHARLSALAALHDIGKANAGFQARWDVKADRIGHEGQVAPLILDPGLRTTPAGEALRAALGGWGAGKYIAALFAHHGRPREEFGPPPPTGGRNESWIKHVRHWRTVGGHDPLAEAGRVLAAVRARWPLAWEDGARLPDAPRFVAMFAGLLVLADWIGSDTGRFPVAGPHGDAREPMRVREAFDAVATRGLVPLPTPDTGFRATFGFDPRGVQAQAAADDLGPVALIEAETGSGKTEAALWRWLQLRARGEVDGLFFALPTRTAAVQLHGRVQAMLGRVWGDDAPEAVLAVPGYLRAGTAEGQALPGWEVRWDDGRSDPRWAAERSNRFLAARVAVGTIDQALLGALRVKHAPVRAAALARSLLVVDEVHASDAYMGRLLERLLDNHVAAGGRVLLLSATLGAAARARLLKQDEPDLAEAAAQPYPALAGTAALPRLTAGDGRREKHVRVEVAGLMADANAVAMLAVEAAQASASVLVIRNSVRDAVAVAEAVEALAPELAFHVEHVPTLHHGRFAPSDRRLLDGAVEAQFGRGRSAAGRVLVGTQTLEQSLDIDADLLLTDLAPMDVLLQRIGRLHRHDRTDRGTFAQARVVVLRPVDRDLALLLGRPQHGLGPRRDGTGVYPNLVQIEATLRLLEANPAVSIPADNRRLVEHALHPQVAEDMVAALGTGWANHLADCNGIAFADRQTGRDLSLDLGLEFRELHFPDMDETVATRLGAQDLLVDFAEPFAGPFGQPVDRLTIPRWMAGGIGVDDQPALLPPDGDGQPFTIGERTFRYGRWGLAPA